MNVFMFLLTSARVTKPNLRGLRPAYLLAGMTWPSKVSYSGTCATAPLRAGQQTAGPAAGQTPKRPAAQPLLQLLPRQRPPPPLLLPPRRQAPRGAPRPAVPTVALLGPVTHTACSPHQRRWYQTTGCHRRRRTARVTRTAAAPTAAALPPPPRGLSPPAAPPPRLLQPPR